MENEQEGGRAEEDAGSAEHASEANDARSGEAVRPTDGSADRGDGGLHPGQSEQSTLTPSPGALDLLSVANHEVESLSKPAQVVAAIQDNAPRVEEVREALLFIFPPDWQSEVRAVTERLTLDECVRMLAWLSLQFSLGYQQAVIELKAAAAKRGGKPR